MSNIELVNQQEKKIINLTIYLSSVEVGLGSILHGLHVPFSGQILSLNQGIFLENSIKNINHRLQAFEQIFITSICISILKSLSPAGKKLGPMISISTQGFLLGIGIIIFGANLVGRIVGMMLLSLWAFVQPFVSYFILYGSDFINALDYFLNKMQKSLSLTNEEILLGISYAVVIKLIIAGMVPFFSDKLTTFIKKKTMSQTTFEKNKRMIKINKFFLPLSFLMMILFYLFHGKNFTEIFWYLLRPISILLIITFIAKSKYFENKLFAKLIRYSFFNKIYRILIEVKKINDTKAK